MYTYFMIGIITTLLAHSVRAMANLEDLNESIKEPLWWVGVLVGIVIWPVREFLGLCSLINKLKEN